MLFSIPNLLTYFRIAVIPVIAALYLLNIKHAHLINAALFALAAISDGLDGYLARKWNQTSKLGAFLDPVADKLLVATILVLVAANQEVVQKLFSPILFVVAVLIIIGREITVSALREWMAELGKRTEVAVSNIGKVKTSFQMGALGFFLFEHSIWGIPVLRIAEILLYVAGVLTVWSMSIYLKAAAKAFNE